MRGVEERSDNADAGKGSRNTFHCPSCGQVSSKGADSCDGCGARYVLQDSEFDLDALEESANDAKIDDFEPVVVQDSLDCGYFDVDSGTMSFTGPACENKYELSECQNCGTMLEVPVKKCPLCGGGTKKMTGGLGTVLSGAVAWRSLDRDSLTKVYCQMCEEMVFARNGRCDNCGGDLAPQSENLSNPIIRPTSADPVVFVHVNFEAGKVSYLTEGDKAEPSEAEDNVLQESPSIIDIDVFGRIGMMFDEQTSSILDMTTNGAMTASEICKRLKIPRSVCYRKLKSLTDAKILLLSKPEQGTHEWYASRYRSNVEMAFVSIEHGEMRMAMRFKDSKETQTQKFASDIL